MSAVTVAMQAIWRMGNKTNIGKIDLLTSYENQRIVVAYLSRETYIERLTQLSKHSDYSIPGASGFHFTKAAAPMVREWTEKTIKKLDSVVSQGWWKIGELA